MKLMKMSFPEIRRKIFVLVLLMSAGVIAACVKGDDEGRPQRSYVSFFNALGGAQDAADFFIDNDRLRTGTVSPDSSSGYNQIYSGSWKITAVPAGGKPTDVLAEETESLESERYYSCFLAEGTSGRALLLVQDTLSAPDSVKHAKVRFVNLSPSAGKVDVVVKDGNTLFSQQEYLKASRYTTIDTSRHTINIYPAGATDGSLATIDIHPGSRKIYTFYLRGAADNKQRLLVREIKR